MTYTMQDLLAKVGPKLGGTSTSDIADFYSTVYTAAWRMASKIDIRGTKRSTTLSSPIYDGITRYAAPTDFGKATDLLPQVTREGNPESYNFTPRFSREFSLKGELNSMAIDWLDDTPVLDIRRYPTGRVVTLADFESTTGWTAAVDASGIYSETLNYIAGSAALGFDLSGVTGSGTLTNSTLTSNDFSTWRTRDSIFVWVYMPSVMTSVTAKRGSSAANYYAKTVTTRQDGTAFIVGWNLLRFDLSSATQTGTANLVATTYIQLTFTYPIGTVISGVIVDSMTDQLGDYYQLDYYSKYLFRTAAGVWSDMPTLMTDIINMEPEAFVILTYEVLDDLVIELTKKGGRGSAAQEGYNKYAKILGSTGRDGPASGLYGNYVAQNPSERVTAQSTMYTFDV